MVEGGTFTMGKVQDDVMHDWNNTPNQQHVMSFYMDETEVTNMMYMEYLDWLKRVFLQIKIITNIKDTSPDLVYMEKSFRLLLPKPQTHLNSLINI